jgi:hypothetical protein
MYSNFAIYFLQKGDIIMTLGDDNAGSGALIEL